jgi:SAM-dependent methyltransferase
VCTYDGRVLPFPDSSFDHVFSSNALEHIDDLPRTMAEIRRVLKTGGSSVHLVPTATWRLWTSITHYPYMARQAARRLFGNSGRAREVDAIDSSAPLRLSNLLVAEKHGAHHSVLRELRAFSAGHWRRLLASGGNSITRFSGSGIYYSGYAVLGSMLDIRCRKRLSRLLGSSCHLVVLRHDA